MKAVTKGNKSGLIQLDPDLKKRLKRRKGFSTYNDIISRLLDLDDDRLSENILDGLRRERESASLRDYEMPPNEDEKQDAIDHAVEEFSKEFEEEKKRG